MATLTSEAIPVTVLTGFLGSGKTSLLRDLLRHPELSDTAVLINEFGEVALDHLLIERLDNSTVVLENGCICCTVRSDLSEALRALYDKRESGACRPFDRIVLETTGLADPAPIIFTLMADPVIRYHFRLGTVVTAVDAVNCARQFAHNPESVKQAAVADLLVLTKTDIASTETSENLYRKLADLNPSARLLDRNRDAMTPTAVLRDSPYARAREADGLQQWLAAEFRSDQSSHDHAGLGRHAAEIVSSCLIFEEPLDWTAFGIWLTMLLNRHGERVLRVKGLLNVPGADTPVVVNGVQHLVHPPFHLQSWPSDDRRSRIVFILRDLDPGLITRSLRAFNRMAQARAET